MYLILASFIKLAHARKEEQYLTTISLTKSRLNGHASAFRRLPSSAMSFRAATLVGLFSNPCSSQCSHSSALPPYPKIAQFWQSILL
jgi:hypothetical protein